MQGAQGWESLKWLNSEKSPSSAPPASPSAAATPAMPTRPISRCWPPPSRPCRQIRPQGRKDRRGHGRRRHQPQPRFQPGARSQRSMPASRRAPRAPTCRSPAAPACRRRLLLGAKIATGEIDSGIAAGSDTVSDSPIVFGDKFQHRLIELIQGPLRRREAQGLQGPLFRRTQARRALDAGAAHRPLDGPALRIDGAAMGHFPRGPGRAGASKATTTPPRPMTKASTTTCSSNAPASCATTMCAPTPASKKWRR